MRKKKYIRKLEKLIDRLAVENAILADALERSDSDLESRKDLN